jgi:hypothetical protein
VLLEGVEIAHRRRTGQRRQQLHFVAVIEQRLLVWTLARCGQCDNFARLVHRKRARFQECRHRGGHNRVGETIISSE